MFKGEGSLRSCGYTSVIRTRTELLRRDGRHSLQFYAALYELKMKSSEHIVHETLINVFIAYVHPGEFD